MINLLYVFLVIGDTSQVTGQMAFPSQMKRLGGFTLSKYKSTKGTPILGSW